MLTRSGLGAIVAAVVLAAFGFWWRYEELVIAGFGVALAVVLAIFIARRPLRATVQRRLVTVRVPRGDPIRLSYRITNTSNYRSGRATLIDRCDEEDIAVPIAPVASNALADVPATIPSRRRGVFEIGPLDIEKIDPLYLAAGRWRHTAAQPNIVTVHPKVYELAGPPGSARVVENESIVRRAATDPMSGFVSMREYVPGDDPRLIHWPTTARAGSLMVRENIEVRRPEFTVVVDAGADLGTADDFEEAVDVAATLAVHAIRTGLDVIVRSTNRAHAGRTTPLRTDAEVLDLLTPLQRCDDEPLDLASLFRNGFDHTSVLLITGPNGPTSHIGANAQMVTIRIGQGAQANGTASLAASDAVDFVNRWRAWS